MVNVSHLGFCLLFLRTSIQISAYFKHRYFGALLLIWDFLTNFLNIGNLACIALVSPIAESYQQNWLLERRYGLQVTNKAEVSWQFFQILDSKVGPSLLKLFDYYLLEKVYPSTTDNIIGQFCKNTSCLCQFLCRCLVAQLCPTLCDPVDCSTSGFPVLHHPGVCSKSCPFSQWCHPTVSSSVIPFSFCLLSPQDHWFILQWVSSSHQVAKVLKLQFQHQFFQWIKVSFFNWDQIWELWENTEYE